MTAFKLPGQPFGEPNRLAHESQPNTLGCIGLPARLGRSGRQRTGALLVLAVLAAFAAILVWHPV